MDWSAIKEFLESATIVAMTALLILSWRRNQRKTEADTRSSDASAYADLSEAIDQLSGRLLKLQTDNTQMSVKFETLVAENKGIKANHSALQQSFEIEKKERERLSQELAAALEENAELLARIELGEKEREELQQKLAGEQLARLHVERSLNKTVERARTLEEKVAVLQEENESLRNTLVAVQQENEALSRALAAYQEGKG